MKKQLTILSLFLLFVVVGVKAQKVYTITADSTLLTGCDSNELIIMNHTQNVPGFLFNTGNGRTIFKRAAVMLNDTTYLVGADTVKLPNAWVQGGNTFGSTGRLGTLDNNHLDFYTNAVPQMRLSNAGNLLMGTTYDNGKKVQIAGRGGVFIDPTMSTPYDMIKIGGFWNTGDGQDIVLSASADSGNSYYPLLFARQGYIGLGYGSTSWVVGNPPVRILPGGLVSIQSPTIYYGSTNGPYNTSALITAVSNTNEWNEGLNNYPNGQNYYYFGTTLGTPQPGYKRAPLMISGNELHFLTGAVDTQAVMISEGQNLLVGTTSDNGNRLQVNGNSYFNNNVCFAGLAADSTQTRLLVADPNGNLFYRNASSLTVDEPVRSSLAVNGPITAGSLRLKQTAWPDYVFDSTYRLPTLVEVESYIHREHHLPGIPSAAAVQKDSLDVGASQTALLKKIEELTLYTIDQNKKLNEQTKQLAVQDQQLASLKKEVEELKTLVTQKK